MEADFPLNDMLPMETGLTEEAPFQLPFGHRGRAVLASRNDEAGWLDERGIQKKIELIDGPKRYRQLNSRTKLSNTM